MTPRVRPPFVEIRDPDDEIVGFGNFHIERMSERSVWIGLDVAGQHIAVSFEADGPVRMRVEVDP